MVKFTSIAIKQALRSARNNRKHLEILKGIYINEDLTASRRWLFNACLFKKKAKQIQGCWTENGKIIIKTNEGAIKQVFVNQKVL
jgi:hypothetical protein